MARIRNALPGGHRLLDLLEIPAFRSARAAPAAGCPTFPGGIKTAANAWSGEIGALIFPGGKSSPQNIAALAWLGRCADAADQAGTAVPQFILDLPPARYRIEYWKAGEGWLAGVEIGTGPCLVLTPPEEAPLVVSVEVLP
ncbi:MAG: hypothetical protein NT061_11745 [Spirochaetes bacterium]|nr:hypothetical protein [Spirochaetota bacterium]